MWKRDIVSIFTQKYPEAIEDTELVVRCNCHYNEHMLIITPIDWGDRGTMFAFSVHLSDVYSFWKRVRIATRYILGRKSQYGCYGEILIGEKAANEISRFLSRDLSSAVDASP